MQEVCRPRRRKDDLLPCVLSAASSVGICAAPFAQEFRTSAIPVALSLPLTISGTGLVLDGIDRPGSKRGR